MGATLLALGVQAQPPAGTPATKAVKPDSATTAARKAAIETSSAALSAKMAAAEEAEAKKAAVRAARRTSDSSAKAVASKDLEEIRKLERTRSEAGVKEMKEEIAAAAKARKAAKQWYGPDSVSK